MPKETSTKLEIPTPVPEKKFSIARHSLAVVVLSAILAGFLGGFAGTVFISSRPELQHTLSNTTDTRKIIKEDSAIIEVVEKSSPAVVSIVVSKDLSKLRRPSGNLFDIFGFPNSAVPDSSETTPNIQQVGAGSGFFVSSDGLILTNRHVVSDESATYSIVTNGGEKYDAEVLARDSKNDLAILKVEISGAPTLSFADSSSVQIGQQVLAIGNSLGQYQNTVTSGIVSGIGRSVTAGDAEGTEQLEGVIQTDAAINPGNSGGPLLNLAGEVIGINTAIDQQGQLVGFAIPSKDAEKAVDSFKKIGKISHPFLGVRYLMLNKEIAKEQELSLDEGALLVSGAQKGSGAVIANSPADKAGFKEGDIIVKINGNNINSKNSLTKELKNYSAGDKLQITIDREGKSQVLSVTLEEAK